MTQTGRERESVTRNERGREKRKERKGQRMSEMGEGERKTEREKWE